MGRISGLTISGTVKERRRRRVPADNPQHEFVTYSLIDEYNTLYFVDDFHPDKYYEIGQSVMLPVYVKTYLKRNSQPAYTIAPARTFRPVAKSFNLRAHKSVGASTFVAHSLSRQADSDGS